MGAHSSITLATTAARRIYRECFSSVDRNASERSVEHIEATFDDILDEHLYNVCIVGDEFVRKSVEKDPANARSWLYDLDGSIVEDYIKEAARKGYLPTVKGDLQDVEEEKTKLLFGGFDKPVVDLLTMILGQAKIDFQLRTAHAYPVAYEVSISKHSAPAVRDLVGLLHHNATLLKERMDHGLVMRLDDTQRRF